MNQIRSAGSGLQTKDSTPIELITQQSRFETVIGLALKQDRVAVDLESNGFYHYTEKICLLQLAFHNQAYLIDTLLLKNFKPLATLFTNNRIEKIFHSADYDIRSLDRDWGIRIHNLFDTSIASAFIGADKRGLASVLAEYLNLNSSNSLLKALEEPSNNTYFFIIHNSGTEILDTIRSRSIEFKLFFTIKTTKAMSKPK